MNLHPSHEKLPLVYFNKSGLLTLIQEITVPYEDTQDVQEIEELLAEFANATE